MSRFTRSLSSEFRKVFATKMWWILALVIAAYAAMMAAAFAFMFQEMPGGMGALGGAGDEAKQSMANLVYSGTATFGYAVPLLFGALAATGELRHRTLGTTFLIEPKRGLVLASKTVVVLAVGAALGIAGAIGNVATAASVMGADDAMLGTADTWALIARVVTALALWAAIGFGVGMLVRNQAMAVVLVLVFTQFVEPVARMGAQFWSWSAQLAKFLPGSASDAFVGASLMNDLSAVDPSAPSAGAEPLTILGGFAVLTAYAVVLLALSWLTRLRRDVD